MSALKACRVVDVRTWGINSDLHGVDDGLCDGPSQRACDKSLMNPQRTAILATFHQPLDLNGDRKGGGINE